jgi:hypothetical protein
MKKIFIILLVVTVGMVSCAKIQEKEIANESAPSVFLPKPIDDDWCRWIIGEWEGFGESDAGKGKGWVQIELVLNGQFLIMKGEAEITQITAEQKQYLKETLHATDEDIEKFQSSTFKFIPSTRKPAKSLDICLTVCDVWHKVKVNARETKKLCNGNGPGLDKGLLHASQKRSVTISLL